MQSICTNSTKRNDKECKSGENQITLKSSAGIIIIKTGTTPIKMMTSLAERGVKPQRLPNVSTAIT